MPEKIIQIVRTVKNWIKSLIILAVSVKLPPKIKRIPANKSTACVVLTNGPSLKITLKNHLDFFKNKKVICVNDFADSPYFEKIRPDCYVLMDPAFCKQNVSTQYNKLRSRYYKIIKEKVDWPMIVFLPVSARKWNPFINLPQENTNITLRYVNISPLYGGKTFRHFFYRHNLAMPVVQNVLVGGIFLALNIGYRRIYLVGADHSWHESFDMGKDNILRLKNTRPQDKQEAPAQPFYRDPEFETIPYRISDLLSDISRMFKSYDELEEYANSLGAKIYNASEKSYIDAFKRYTI